MVLALARSLGTIGKLKSQAESGLLTAVEEVMSGKRFLSALLA